jgi:hypothetical protein
MKKLYLILLVLLIVLSVVVLLVDFEGAIQGISDISSKSSKRTWKLRTHILAAKQQPDGNILIMDEQLAQKAFDFVVRE